MYNLWVKFPLQLPKQLFGLGSGGCRRKERGFLQPILLNCNRYFSTINSANNENHRNALLDFSSEHIDTTKCRNQQHLAEILDPYVLRSDKNKKAFEAFRSIDRVLFLPSASTEGGSYSEPYANRPQQLLPDSAPSNVGATLSTPYHQALILSILHDNGLLNPGDSVLDVGCGSGWMTAAFYHSVNGKDTGEDGQVVAVDRIPELVEFAKLCLEKCPITSEATKTGKIKVVHAYDEANDQAKFNLDQILSHGPYDLIHVGFSFDPEKDSELLKSFTEALRDSNSRILAGWGPDLCLFDKKGFRKELNHIPGMARIQRGQFVKPKTRTERLEKAKNNLDDWKSKFERQHKRKATKDDLFNNAEANALFREFSSLTKLS